MRNKLILLASAALAIGASGAVSAAGGRGSLAGDYVEARTASVFAGACHYNGELTTTGKHAEMVWHVDRGSWDGVDVSGLTVLAAVSSTDNLKNTAAQRESAIFIDAKATPAQAEALEAAIEQLYGASLGKVVSVKAAPISFQKTGEHFAVVAPGVSKLVVDAMPNRECCKQPNLVWYAPLVKIDGRRVGYTRASGITAAVLGEPWEKSGQNTAFYGEFDSSR